MQQGTRMDGYQAMTEWLEQQERRLRALEEENRELRRQLSELRRGVGIAVVVEGRTMPLAEQAESAGAPPQGTAGNGADPWATQWGTVSNYPGVSAAPTQVYPARGHTSFGPTPSIHPDPASGSMPDGGQGHAPTGRHVSQSPALQHAVPAGLAQMQTAPQRQTYPPLAASPDQLPPPARLQPTPPQGSFGGSEPWAVASPGNRTSAHAPTQRHDVSHPLWGRPAPSEPARNPFADSFML